MEAKIRDGIGTKQNVLIESVPGLQTTLFLMKIVVETQSEYRCKQEPFGVVYIARNGATLKNVSKEVQAKCEAREINCVILGTRRELCLVDEVRNERSLLTQHYRCQFEVTSRKRCLFGIHYKKNKKVETLDIEDLNACRQSRICPFFAATNSKFAADVILTTHKQIFNSTLQRTHEPFWQDKVVVIDDAETLDTWCEESLSKSMTLDDVKACFESVKTLGDVHMVRMAYANQEETEQPVREISTAEVSCVVLFLEKVYCFMQSACTTYRFSITHFSNTLQNAGNKTTFSTVSSLLKKLVQFSISAHLKCGCLPELPGDVLEKVAEFLEVLSRIESSGNNFNMCLEVTLEECDDDAESESDAVERQRTLHVWCFNPTLLMHSFLRHKPRCLIICTSNTHSFPSSFRNTLCIENSININDNEKKLLIRIIKDGPGGISLRAPDPQFVETLLPEYHYYVDVDAYSISVGRLLAQIAKIVPLGVVVFFSSVELLDCCVERWKECSNTWNELASLKLPVVLKEDERPASSARKYCAAFSNDSSNGGLMLTTSGSWVSEHSYHFQTSTRAVLFFGVYWEWPHSEFIRARMKFADFQKNNSRLTHPFVPSQSSILDGKEWYNLMAHRELSEALAVCDAFHKTAILFCDPRIEVGVRNRRYPLWLEKRVEVCSYNRAISELKQHFIV